MFRLIVVKIIDDSVKRITHFCSSKPGGTCGCYSRV